MKLLIVLSLCSIALAVRYEMPQQWNLWKSQHGKTYKSDKEDLERHLNWVSNKKYIDMHNANADVFGFTLAMNHLGDMTETEYKQLYLGSYDMIKGGNYTSLGVKPFQHNPFVSYPETIDWRTNNAVTDVKNQGNCGSSYAFSATGSLEGAHSLAHGSLVSLSEQNIIDCSVSFGNNGCKGGSIYNSFKYIVSNNGINSEKTYPYTEYQSSCLYNSNYKAATASGLISISKGSEDELLSAVATVGPVSVGVDANSKAFMYYDSGVYDSSTCSSYQTNHAMLVTGYGSYNGNDYWLVKSSWGKNWGMSGYIWMSRGKYNQCGIASDASYPTL